jgi:hypothetical protein
MFDTVNIKYLLSLVNTSRTCLLDSKVFPLQTVKACGAVEVWLHTLITMTHTFTALPAGEEPPVPLKWVAGWASTAVWLFGEGKSPLPLPQIELQFLRCLDHILVTIPTVFVMPSASFCRSMTGRRKYNLKWTLNLTQSGAEVERESACVFTELYFIPPFAFMAWC